MMHYLHDFAHFHIKLIAEVTCCKYALMCKIVKKTRNVTIFIQHTVAIGSFMYSMAVDVLFVNTFLLKLAILEEFSANIKIII